MNGDHRWRTLCVNPTSSRPFLVWRIRNGATEYHRSAPTNYAPNGRIIRYGYQAARDKARELNAPSNGNILGDGSAPDNPHRAGHDMSAAGDTVKRCPLRPTDTET
ncbi:hypothetical protein QN239_33150 [Mycolicibacterium sp. Y3]